MPENLQLVSDFEAINQGILKKPDLILEEFTSPDTPNPENLLNSENILRVFARHQLNFPSDAHYSTIVIWNNINELLKPIANQYGYTTEHLEEINITAHRVGKEVNLEEKLLLIETSVSENPGLFTGRDANNIRLGLNISIDKYLAPRLEDLNLPLPDQFLS